ncbi:hypothetical protein [Flavobacterium sp. JAS]|uniref:hypothetical protein n=1 Tax=Flavobacterium sp. JAS TaxID=2897329 RepID=UPI001E29EDAE|nr:hypothetical protein [Flavobacterium sp. JAS]MCD0468248.1 hypothetical protein [Flavobacterium sp. JAS]
MSTESMLVKTNTTVLLTGETLYYQLYCLNKSTILSDISEMAYIEIINNQKESVFKNKVRLKNGLGSGDYFIPTTLPTGNYKIIAYTSWMLNNTQNNFSETDITIINPFQENINMIVDNADKKSNNDADETKNSINKTILGINKEKYSKREKASLIIPKTLESGNYFLSIRKIDSIPALSDNKNGTINLYLKQDLTVLPETRGEIVTGHISSKIANSDLSYKIVTLSIPGKNFIFKTTKTDRNGKFIFIIDKQTNTSDSYFQLSESDRENYSITIDKEPSPDLSNLVFSNRTTISSKNLKAIQERSLATQIENVYFSQKKDSIIESTDTAVFFESIEKKYNLDDFDRFRTFKETIIEIVTELSFKDYNQVPSLYLADTRYNVIQTSEPCVVLVDGLQIQDMNALYNYNAYQIQSISVVSAPYYYGPKLFNGIVSIITKNKDFATIYSDKNILKTTILRPEPTKLYYTPKYESNTANRIPDYRYQLLWKPNIRLQNTEIIVPFYISDISGNFQIILEGLSDKGDLIHLDKIFKVE